MYNAPAVSFPADRSLFAAFSLGLIWVVGAIACACLAVMPLQPVWLPPAVAALCMGVGLAALGHWRKLPVGLLHWDRKHWTIIRSGEAAQQPIVLNDIAVHVDFQWVMLLSFRQANGQRLWVWLESARQGREPLRLWRALRRAVHARPRDTEIDSKKTPKRIGNLAA